MPSSNSLVDTSRSKHASQASAEAVKLWISELTDFSPQKIDEVFETMQQDQSLN
ncbi:MAG: hypothetical protein ACFCU8_21250 [Thermosynechococcaceae cyanobacterium]